MKEVRCAMCAWVYVRSKTQAVGRWGCAAYSTPVGGREVPEERWVIATATGTTHQLLPTPPPPG